MSEPVGRRQEARLFTGAFLLLSLADLAYFTAFGLLIPVVPLFASGPLAVGPVGVGVAVGTFSVTALVLRPFAGRLADRWDRQRLLVAGALWFTVVVAAHLAVTEYWALPLLRVLLGIAEAVFFVAGVAALSDLAPAERLGAALSYNSLALYLGISVGPALGEWLLCSGGFRAAWTGAIGLGAAATLLASCIPPLPVPAAGGTPAPLLPARLVGPGLAFLAGLAGAAGFLAFAALHARDVGLAGAGPVLFVYGAVVLVCRIAFAKHVDRAPAVHLSAAALVLCAVGLASMAALRNALGFVSGPRSSQSALLTPAFYRALMSQLPASQHGAAAATFSVFVDLGLGVGPILFGLVAKWASIPAAFGVGAAFALLAAVGLVGGRLIALVARDATA